MSSPSRVFAVLGLFSQEKPVWHTDDINAALGYTRATGYRYVKELVDAGLLQKVSVGCHALGARIIELDYQLRQSDPLLLAAIPVMESLAARAGLDVVLSALFGGDRVIDTHRVPVGRGLKLHYGRGRPRPLFSGAAPKVLVAHLPRAKLLRLFEKHRTAIADAGLGGDWPAFRTAMADIRSAGFYRSMGESDEGIGAIAVPVANADGETIAALALVGTTDAIEKLDDARWSAWMAPALRQLHKYI
jgi:DNA-binding IclR family transcriptional regulator